MTFGQLQEIRTYYDFVSVDDDRYWIDGKYRQVLLSPRELNAASLPTRTFINEHLTFTHGMGLTLGPVNQVTTEGLPVLFIKDLPPVSTVSLKVTRPQIYYGELANEYVVRGHAAARVRPPRRRDQRLRRLRRHGRRPGRQPASAARCSPPDSAPRRSSSRSDITSDSRVLYYRDIADRAQKALPFLQFDRDPYLVIAADGTLKWILDALHHLGRLSLRPAARGRHDLHAEQRQARHRRVRRVAQGLS